ncbi:hypothetical protein [Alkalinema sp. FACHB-956]|uniref:hypothetical protein n=1 Tax=Alkalinema sp. FACHB-956 TaxID=2692768 RepID=UPI00168968BF|nr:hypothetical protein [Alkalinema sp. FACHB-956]MBD2326240.1 hypothetical protein [Alkalinema sp. FACHB-956]
MTQSKILLAAQEIRPHLASLLDPETAQTVDRQLQTLLTQAESGQAVEIQITELLRNHTTTREWMRRYLKGEDPVGITRSFNLPGNPAPVTNPLIYRCPKCDYITDIPFVGITPDPCPDHPTVALISG